jgi:hypothetical protein
MPSPVVIRIARRLPHPRDGAYAWLTDFQDDDARRAGGAVLRSRKVTLREKTRVVYEGHTEVLGRASRAVTDVTLMPPERWEARVVEGPRTGSWTDYSLVPDGPDACRLSVTYHFVFADPKRQLAVRVLKPLVRRSLARMWAGFAADMARDL